MRKINKIKVNNLREKAKEMRSACEEIGRPDIGVEFTNISHEYEKILKEQNQ